MLKLINWSLSFQLFNKIHVTHIFAYEIMCARGEGEREKTRVIADNYETNDTSFKGKSSLLYPRKSIERKLEDLITAILRDPRFLID